MLHRSRGIAALVACLCMACGIGTTTTVPAARVRLSIDGQTGNLVSLQLTHSSGDARFDTGAVASVRSAFPISPAPARELWSSDGGVHVDWELHRDPNNACSTYFARPYLFVDNER